MADLKVKISEFPLATEAKDSDDIAILQDGVNKRIKTPKIEEKILEKVEERYVNKNKLGVSNGVATLGSDGKLSESQRFAVDINPSFIPIDLTTPPSEVDGVFLPTASGVYENYGGLSIDLDLGSYLITKIGDTYKSILLAVESTLIANNIEDLRSKEPAYEGQIITLLGYYEAGDKEPLNYKWTSEQGVDDGGAVINTESGSWKAIFNESINTKDFGVSSADLDSSFKINSAIKYANSAGIRTVINDIKINVSAPSSDRTDGAIKILSNIDFINKSTIKLNATDYENYAIISASNVSNITIEVGEIIGDRDIHVGTGGEWGMGVNLRNVENYKILNGSISKCWGDGLYIGGGASSSVYNRGCYNGEVSGIISYSNRRQGCSITCAENLKIINSVFKDTNGTLPMSGLDIEPNNNQNCKNITIEGCEFLNNTGSSIAIAGLANNSLIDNIVIKNCYSDNIISVTANISELTAITSNILITECDLKVVNQYGIRIVNLAKSVTVSKCSIELHNDTLDILSGVSVFKANDCIIEDNRLKSTSVTNATIGISAADIGGNHIVKNNIISGYRTGISASTSLISVESNRIYNCDTGIYYIGSYGNMLDNYIFGCDSYAIQLASGSFKNIVKNNILYDNCKTITNNTGRYIYLRSGCTENIISENVITHLSDVVKPAYGIEEVVGSSNNKISWNIINDNFVIKIRNLSSNLILFDLGSENIINDLTPTATDLDTAVSLANALQSKVNEMITKLKSNGNIKRT